MSNKFFCPLPWNHLMFKPRGTVQACCETYDDQFLPSETIAETANNPIIKQLRLDLLDPDIVPSMCYKCSEREKYQNFSVRLNTGLLHNHITPETAQQRTSPDGSVDNFRLEHLDIRWSNLCNYKCRFCGIASSNLWLKDSKALGFEVSDKFNPKTGISEYNMDWEDLKTHLPYIRYCKLAGGEPTIMPGTYQLLEELINVGNTNCIVSLVTNATTIKYGKYNLLDLLGQFKSQVRIQLSMEGMGARHAWSRSGKDDWDSVAQNIDSFWKHASLKRWKLNFHSGISWMNMYHLAEFIETYPHIDFIFNMVTHPSYMSLTNFYKSDLEKCNNFYIDKIENTINPEVKKRLSVVKNAINKALKTSKETIDLKEFRRTQGILDESRNQSFAKAYPEWSHYA